MYSLNKSRRVLKSMYEWFQQKNNGLTQQEQNHLRELLSQLNQSTELGEKERSDNLAHEVESFAKVRLKKTPFQYIKEFVIAIALALVIATVIRASWFELYQIPTGSMRPNFKEQDHLTVSKLPFGINIPLMTDHFFFEPQHVQRTSAVTFTGDNIRTINETTPFLYIFPYKKRLIKRMVGLPGDYLYFYGGQIYGIDKDGKPINELLTSPWLEKIEYIPFLKFTGEIKQTGPAEATFSIMDKAIGKLSLNPFNEFNPGEVWNGSSWIKDDPSAQKEPHTEIKTYSDWWGIRNYATARLLTREQVKNYTNIDPSTLTDGVLYLELRHTPSLTYPKPILTKGHRSELLISPFTTIIPLQQKDLNTLMDNMYTARLVFENGRARRYSLENERFDSNSPKFPGVPDGTYEFYFGKAVKVGPAAITSELPRNHPLYNHSPENIQKLFNLGIEMNSAYEPHSAEQLNFPNRYAYFRNGDLYVLGAPLLKKEDPTLLRFNELELKKEKQSSKDKPYIAFKDYGAPIKDNTLDADFIRTFGVHVPDQSYFVLGDNHAMSGDSRIFGFIPQNNLQGAPSLILWPPGDRWGIPFQKPYPIVNLPRIIVWSLAAVIGILWYFIQRHRLWKPINI